MELIKFQEEHFVELINAVKSSAFLLQWGGPAFEYPLTVEQLRDYEKSEDQYVFTAVEHGEVVGHISIKYDAKNNYARIGKVMIFENMRGNGIGERMVRAACDFAFDRLQCHKIALGVFDFNLGAIHCYKKVGFQTEGIIRDARKYGDEYWTLVEMGMFRNEFINKDKD